VRRIQLADNLEALRTLDDGLADLIYIDPPFNTGRERRHEQIRVVQSETGARTGFAGRRYDAATIGSRSFADCFDDYLAYLEPRLAEGWRVLADDGTMYVHLDWRESHYVKVLLDAMVGRERFLNEIIWAYDYGGRTKKRWPPKHDVILVYVKDPKRYTFNADAVDRIPYMAPGLVGAEKAAQGKLPTDTWWHTIVPTNSREKTGYPTQKPLGILRRIVAASSDPGDLVLDFFAGSGTTGAACLDLGRDFLLIDENPEALEVMAGRFEGTPGIEWVGHRPASGAPAPRDAMLPEVGVRSSGARERHKSP